MLPWLAHGHISPFLELAKKLTRRNFHIYLCSSPVNLNFIESKLSDHPNPTSIQLVELHLPTLPELPPHCHTTNGLPPHLMPTLMKAFDMSRSNFSNIVETLKPDLIINDFHPAWLHDVASSLSVSNVIFITSGASILSFAYNFMKNTLDDIPFPELCLDSLITKFAQMRETMSNSIRDADDSESLLFIERSCKIVLIRSFRELEGKYMDYLSVLVDKKIVPVGPLIPDHVQDSDEGKDIINWLDKKEKSSTVFVSFGSEYYLSKEDMEEIAHGLELSNVSFIWVVRFPEGDQKMKPKDALPDGYLERVSEKGIIVDGWAPQVKILEHPSIGGFVTHCGWGSFMESLIFGVPIIAMPMQLDQPMNAKLAEMFGVGIEVKRDEKERLARENVAKVIAEVVVGKTGEDVRRRAKEMCDRLKKKSDAEIDGAVKELLQLCEM